MSISADVRQGWREFRSRPLLSAVAVVTLALGVAGATTMFTTLKGIGAGMVPPGVDPARVGRVVWTTSQESGARGPLSGDGFVQLKASADVFEALSASADERLMLGGDGGPNVTARQVTADYFRTFGCIPNAGRVFDAADMRGATRVAIVSEGLLQRQPGLLPGHVARLGGDDYEVVGVMPARCWFPSPGSPDVWLPMRLTAGGVPTPPTVNVTARLRSSAALELAQSAVGLVGQRLAQQGSAGPGRRLRMIVLAEDANKRMGMGIVGFLGPSLVVLLIACGNVANLLLARGARREREMAIRVSLGAGRLRLVRERLAESAWLGIAGGALGMALAFLGVRLLRLWIGSFESARSAAANIQLDARTLLFAVLVTLAIPLVFGLVPALAASKPNLARALHQSPGRKRPRRGPYGGRDLLVVVEIGLAVVLVVTTGMIAGFFAELDRIECGFDPSRILVVELSLHGDAPEKTRDALLLSNIVDAVRHVPGVRAAAAGEVTGLPHPNDGGTIEFENCASATGNRAARTMRVGPGYFAALGLPIRRGRTITEQDTAGSAPVGVISEKPAAQCWPGQDPIGRRFRLRRAEGDWITVVGVVPDVMTTRLLPDGPQPVYLSYAQGANPSAPDVLLVRSDGDPAVLAKSVRVAVRRVDATQPLDSVERLDRIFHEQMGGASLLTGILGGFGLFALALGALGVFSVMSYMVAERTREFGIRIALGASRRDIMALVLRHALIIVGMGTAVSVVGTLAVTRVTFRLMADVAMTDPILWTWVSALLAVVAIAAGIVPARRAMRVEPIVALRAE
jgi:putative ABC transport system permease protein